MFDQAPKGPYMRDLVLAHTGVKYPVLAGLAEDYIGYIVPAYNYVLDPNNRISAIIGLSDADFQIPNLHDEQPSLGLTVNGQSSYPSEFLNENQREVTQFGILSLQHSNGPLTLQTSFIARNSTLGFTPDPLGDLAFDQVRGEQAGRQRLQRRRTKHQDSFRKGCGEDAFCPGSGLAHVDLLPVK